MTSGGAEDGPPVGGRDVREVGDGETVSATVLRDFLLTCLRHDALHDAVIERLDDLAKDGELDITRLAKVLPEVHEQLLVVVKCPDWIYAAGALMDAYRDAAEGGERR